MATKCNHEFQGGLCTKCLAPATSADSQRAVNAVENASALQQRGGADGRRLSREDAIFEAWRSHRQQ